MLSLRAWPNHVAWETVIAHALRLRGAEVAVVTCGGGQPICEMGWGRRAYPRPCDRCAWSDRLQATNHLPGYRLVNHFDWERADAAPPEGTGAEVDPGWASAISGPWFLKTSRLEEATVGVEVAADFRAAAAAVSGAPAEMLDDFRPDIVLMVNGDFASERVFRALASERGIRVTSYETAPTANTLFFSHEAPACDYETGELWERVRDRPLTSRQQRTIDELLDARAHGRSAHESYFTASGDQASLRAELEIPSAHRVISLFSNVSWDSAALDRGVAFPTMIDWIVGAITECGALDDATLVVRLHPAESTWGTNLDIEAAVHDRVGPLPANVRLIAAATPLSTYALVELSDLALTYTTTVGLEAAFRGVPVAVAARTHYRDRGFTWDLGSPDALARIVRERPAMSQTQRELAARYAFTFFFRAAIPFPIVPVSGGVVERLPEGPDELRPGHDRYLDLICDRILDGEPFAVDDALLPA